MATLKTKIMRRVYAIWFVRQALPVFLGSAGSFYLAFRVAANRFFAAEILKNLESVMKSNVWGLPRYIESALNSVEPSILILIAMAGIVSFALAVKLLRSVRSLMWGSKVATSWQKF